MAMFASSTLQVQHLMFPETKKKTGGDNKPNNDLSSKRLERDAAVSASSE